MLALETYGRRISDERPQTKYHRNPSCREDIKWLLALSMKLGMSDNEGVGEVDSFLPSYLLS